MLSPEAQRTAEEWAASDRDLLARLRRAGTAALVKRDTPRGVAGARAFQEDIEARAFPEKRVNLAIRPKKKRKR